MTDQNAKGAPQITDQRTPPPGILPRNAQTWMIIGLTAIMVAAIWFSGGKTPKQTPATPPVANTVLDPNVLRIQEYKNRLEEETRKLKAEQAQLDAHEEALGATSAHTAGPLSPAAAGYSADSYPHPEEVAFRAAKEKREYESLFAPNVAFSLRKELTKESAPQGIDEWNKMLSFYSALASSQRPNSSSTPTAPTVPPGAVAAVSATPDGARQPPEIAKPDTKERQTGKNSAHNDHDHRVLEGTVIETVLTNRLDGSFSGPVNCMVTTKVFSRDGQHVLIPQGSRALGEVRKVESFGQERLAVTFHRLIMPDGYSVNLDKVQGLNQIGETGLRDQVSHHYWQVFGVSLAIGAIAGLGESQSRTGLVQSGADAYEQGVATSLSQSSLRILDRYLNVLPTFTIREGHRVKIYLSEDLWLPAYDHHQISTEGGL